MKRATQPMCSYSVWMWCPLVTVASRTRSSSFFLQRLIVIILLNQIRPFRCAGVYYRKAILHLLLGGGRHIVRKERLMKHRKEGYAERTLDHVLSGGFWAVTGLRRMPSVVSCRRIAAEWRPMCRRTPRTSGEASRRRDGFSGSQAKRFAGH